MSRTLRIPCLAIASLLTVGLTTASAQLEQKPSDEYIASMEKGDRVAPEKIADVIAKLRLKPGDTVADIGSGGGLFTIPMAKAIAPGTMYAVDIDQKMIDYVVAKAKKAGLTNVVGVLGEYDDPKLPVKTVDVAFYHRVLHMIEHRQAHLNATAKYLKEDGRIIIIEKNREDASNWMWLNQSDVDTWMAAIAFYPAEHFGTFDDRYFVSYQRPYGNSVLLKKGKKDDAKPADDKKTDATPGEEKKADGAKIPAKKNGGFEQ